MNRNTMNGCTPLLPRRVTVPLLGAVSLLGLALTTALSAAPPAAILPGVVDRPPVELPAVLSEDRVEIPVAAPQPLQPAAAEAEPVATLTRVSFDGALLLKSRSCRRLPNPT